MSFSRSITSMATDTIKQSPKKYEKIAEDFLWLKEHPNRTSQYRFGGRKVILSSDLPSEVRAENSQRTNIQLKNLTRIPTIIRMKYDIYELEKQFKAGKITVEQFNNKADSLGLQLYKGPSSMQRVSNRGTITYPVTDNPAIKANNEDVKAVKPTFDGDSSIEELEKIDEEYRIVNNASNSPIKRTTPLYY